MTTKQLSTLKNMPLELEPVVNREDIEQFEGYPDSIHTVNGQLWLPASGRIMTITIQPNRPVLCSSVDVHKIKVMHSIETRSRKTYHVEKIACTSAGDIFVLCKVSKNGSDTSSEDSTPVNTFQDDMKYIYRMQLNGEIISPPLHRAAFLDICASHDTVYGLVKSTTFGYLKLRLYKYKKVQGISIDINRDSPDNNGYMEQIEPFWVKHKDSEIPLFNTSVTAYHNDIYFVNEQEGNIKKLTHNEDQLDGQLHMTSHGKKGCECAGDLERPRICFADNAGSVMVADYGNRRLQVLSAANEFFVLNFSNAPVDFEPIDASQQSNGDIFILCQNGSIYKVIKP